MVVMDTIGPVKFDTDTIRFNRYNKNTRYIRYDKVTSGFTTLPGIMQAFLNLLGLTELY